MLARVVLIVALVLSGAAASAQVAVSDELAKLEAGIEARSERLAEIEASLQEPRSAIELRILSEAVRRIRREADAVSAPLLARQDAVQADLDSLGPPPAEGEPPETDEIAQRRKTINALNARIDDALARAALNVNAANRIAEAIATSRRDQFTGRLLSRGPLLLAPAPWVEAAAGLAEVVPKADAGIRRWVDERLFPDDRPAAQWWILGALLLAAVIIVPVRRAIKTRFFSAIADVEPLPSRRVLVAGLRTIIRLLFGVIAGVLVYEALKIQGAIPRGISPMIVTSWFCYIVFLGVEAAVRSLTAPHNPKWRVLPFSSRQVFAIRVLSLLAAGIYVAELMFRRAVDALGGSPVLVFVQQGVATVALGLILFLLTRGSLWPAADEAADGSETETGGSAIAPSADKTAADRADRFWDRIRPAGRLLSALAVLAALVGFVDLGYYITTRISALTGLIAVCVAARALLREAIRMVDERFTSKTSGREDPEEQILHSWIGLIIDAVVVLLFIPPALLVLGSEWSDVRGWLSDAFFGFQVGGVRISLAKVLSAGATFVALMWMTRTIQRVTEKELFPRSRIDPGIQNSLKTLIGYVGIVFAAGAAIGVLGFDLSSLAIVAGALSVGIGFGLQSVTSNFISGLILLFERPIKVGDWVVTTSGEGIVKKISVRSTEIETFDKSSVIIPNAEFITSAVTNWTHKNKMGRVVVPVGVSYDSDAARVFQILQEMAQSNPDFLKYPEPFVVFEDFGASSLDFTVRGYIRDIGNGLGVRTRLRIAIHERFKQEGIEIPFPQRDLHLRDLPAGLLTGNAAQPTRGEGTRGDAAGADTPPQETQTEEEVTEGAEDGEPAIAS